MLISSLFFIKLILWYFDISEEEDEYVEEEDECVEVEKYGNNLKIQSKSKAAKKIKFILS